MSRECDRFSVLKAAVTTTYTMMDKKYMKRNGRTERERKLEENMKRIHQFLRTTYEQRSSSATLLAR